eukprot:6765794-Lingulodinium_polyedra.AAC.1
MSADPNHDYYGIGLAMVAIWMAVLRFRHAQRCILMKLTKYQLQGAVLQGKGKPGYRWAMPRYGPLGCDVGG